MSQPVKNCCTEGCSKPRASKTIAYCKECNATYHRNRGELKEKLDRAKGFRDGVEAMRKTLADEFMRHERVMVRCKDVAEAISQAPGPQIQG